MTRVLVTGATGFAGRYICRELVGRGHEVIGTKTQSSVGIEMDGVSLRTLDILDVDATRRLVGETQPDRVLHLAGIASPANGDKLAFFSVNTLASMNVLDGCRHEASALQKVILTSSANVYGEPGLEVLHEDLCAAPVNAYGCSKLAMEQLSANYRDDFSLQIVRPFNFTGRGQTTRFLVPKIVEHFRKNKSDIELGNVHVSRDFSDVRDVAREFADLVDHVDFNKTVNICSGDFLKLEDILSLCRQITGHELTVTVNPNFMRANEIVRLRGCRNRLNSVLGPRPARSFEDTLRWMLQAD